MLLILSVVSLLVSEAFAVTDYSCFEEYFDRADRLKSYSAILEKREYDFDGDQTNDNRIRVEGFKPNRVRVTYLNGASTGIKGSGFVAEYDGSPAVKFKLGESSGLGSIVKGLASVFGGDSMLIDDSNSLRGEYFTINNAGFFPVAQMLKAQVKWVKGSKRGGFTHREGDRCKYRYERHTDEEVIREIAPGDSIFDLEKEFATYAFLIQHNNRDQFSSLYDLFHRKKTVTIRIPRWFYDFDVEIDPEQKLLKRVVFYQNQKIFADYLYSKVESKEDL